jgi:hypothetical protein
MPAGQRIEKEYVFSDPATHSPKDAQGKRIATLCRDCRIPQYVGEYEFEYMAAARVGFQVVEPKIEL